MNGFVEKLNKVLEVILGMIGIAMILIQTYAVFARNVLQVASPWTDATKAAPAADALLTASKSRGANSSRKITWGDRVRIAISRPASLKSF